LPKIPSEKEAIDLLKKTGCSPNVIKHCEAVANLATRIARKIAGNGNSVDVKLVRVGALLHDIGRARTHGIEHAIAGAEMARSFNLAEPVVQIIERHIGSGITAKEATKLGLPKKSFLPRSLEEKIVSYSDKLIEGSREVEFEEALETFSVALGAFLGPPAVKRLRKLHGELSSLSGESA